MADIAADLAELHTLLKSAVREGNRKLLGDAIIAANAALATSGSAATATAAPASAPAPHAASPPAPVAVSAPVPLAVSAPVPLAVSSTVASGAAAPATWFDEPSYGWSEAGDFIEVLITDERLRGVGALPKEAVTCDFGESSFDLKILGLAGRNFRVRVPALEKNIVPAASKCSVGKNRVKLHLKKAGQYDYWATLAAKKGKAAAAQAAKSPDGGIMDMMREMYNDGDDQMKKTIAEAWTKSQAERAGGGGAGGAGGFGGGGLGGAADALDADL